MRARVISIPFVDLGRFDPAPRPRVGPVFATCGGWLRWREIISAVDAGLPDTVTHAQRAWTIHSEALWARARAIAGEHPGVDAGDVYHALRCLELTPTTRLKQAFSRGRLRADGR